MKKAFALVLLLALTAGPAAAQDVLVRVKAHADAMSVGGQSQPERDDVSEQWYSTGRTAQNGRDSGFIVDLHKNVAYMINHRDRSYVAAPLPLDITKILPPEAQQMAPMLQMTATVVPTAERKTIGRWPCTAYDATLTVMGMPMTMRVWASTEVPASLVEFAAKVMPAFLQGQMRLTDESVREFTKIRGFQIATELTAELMGARMRTTTETVEILETAAPAGTFEPPAGYTQRATLSLGDLQRR
ncbi:MAG TPA: hypothetical protein PLE61_08290 [Vicinamibacterales bacterium]|nr:hypothetical protein [Vicinamibacterales bacterium]HPW20799.1 hypothetical protein [Vicinamibacterales bacterium]